MTVSTPAKRDEPNELLRPTSRENPKAFAELYKRTSSKLFGVCLRMLRDRGEAEGVLQETYGAMCAAPPALTRPRPARSPGWSRCRAT